MAITAKQKMSQKKMFAAEDITAINETNRKTFQHESFKLLFNQVQLKSLGGIKTLVAVQVNTMLTKLISQLSAT